MEKIIKKRLIKMFRPHTKALIFILCVILIGTMSPIANSQQPATVHVNKVKIQNLSENATFIARIVALQSGYVSARTGGPVKDLQVELGDYLKKDSIIAKTDTSLLSGENYKLKALVYEAEQQVVQARSESDLKLSELKRIEKLRDSVAFSQSQYDDAKQLLKIYEGYIEIAKAKKSIAESNLAINEVNLKWSIIRAPYNGVVTAIHTEVGSWLQKGQNVVTMLNNKELEIAADIPSSHISGIILGMPIPLSLVSGETYQAIVRAIIPEENPLSRTIQVRFTPEASFLKKAMAPGQSVTIELPAGIQKKSITVHKDAIITMGGQTFVYVAESGTAQIRPVKTGLTVGNRFEVINGLRNGELVVVLGNERLQPGQLITINNETEK